MTIKKKVLLQPLERLDLEDVQGLQDIVHEQMARLLGGLVTNGGGLLKKWSSASTINNSTHLINFDKFSFFARSIVGTDASQGSVCVFDSSLSTNSTCDFTVARTLSQAYYNTNSSLPPNPKSAGYVSATHSQYYPPIFAKRVLSSGDTQNRRFWSVVDGAEVTQAIATRQIESTQFHVGVPSDLGDEGEGWSLIGRITEWSLSGSTIQLSLGGITPYYLADQLVGNSLFVDKTNEWIALTNPSGVGGIQEGMGYLRTRLDDLTEAFDTLSSSLTTFMQKKKRGSITAKHILNVANPFSNILSITQNTLDDFNLDVRQDFEPVEQLGTITTPYTAEKVNVSNAGVRAMLASYVVLVPQAYENMLFNCSIQTIVPMTDTVSAGVLIDFRGQDTKGFDILLDGQETNIINANKIRLIYYTDASGATNTGYGFKIRRRDYLNTAYAQDQYNIAMFSLDITIG